MHNDCPGRRVFAPFKSCPGFVGERGAVGWMKLIHALTHHTPVPTVVVIQISFSIPSAHYTRHEI